MTKQAMIAALQECAEELGHAPSHVELLRHAGVSRKMVRRHFANYRGLLAECNLSGSGSGYQAEMKELFEDWAKLVRALKKVPTIAEYELQSRFSVRPLVTRFGTWNQVPYGLKLHAEEQGWAAEWKDVMAIVETWEEQRKAAGEWKSGAMKSEALKSAGPDNARRARRFAARRELEQAGGPKDPRRAGREVYGGLMRPGPMVCAPVNELGVVFLFGAMAEKLGFAVLKIRAEYPDCLAFRQVEEGRLELVRIEFEWESRNFLLHLHESSQCDLIVCWRHNWPECPVEVVELSGTLTADERG
jgi:HNH endonuclease